MRHGAWLQTKTRSECQVSLVPGYVTIRVLATNLNQPYPPHGNMLMTSIVEALIQKKTKTKNYTNNIWSEFFFVKPDYTTL